MIPGPLGMRWRDRWLPRLETGELASGNVATPYRVRRWVELAPRIGADTFIKLFTHGAQERNSSALLRGVLESAFNSLVEEANRRGCSIHFVTAWQMYLAIEAIRQRRDPCRKTHIRQNEEVGRGQARRLMLNVGIVGCGKIADGHIEEIQKLGCARVLAVCDLEPILAEQLSLRYSVPHWYTDFDRMLSEHRLDIIHIATPPQSHLALARKSAEAGCHVFLEKPLALNATEGRHLIDCLQQSGRKMTINYWYNFETPALALKGIRCRRASWAIPVHIESFYGYDLAGSFGQALLADDRHWVHQLPGRLFQNIIDHAINKITPFLPDEPLEIVARAYRRRPVGSDDRRRAYGRVARDDFCGSHVGLRDLLLARAACWPFYAHLWHQEYRSRRLCSPQHVD